MGLCVDSQTLTFDGVRADDGGQPEEVTLTITKYSDDPTADPVNTYPPEAYDTRYDTEIEFSPLRDGSYKVVYTGGVSGLIETDNVLVKIHSNKNIGHLACSDIKTLMCNSCTSDEYMHKKALSAMADAMSDCERFLEADAFLDDILNFDDCSNSLINGCS
jgi:hypothetical protein